MKRPFTKIEKERLSKSIKDGYKNGRIAWAKGQSFTAKHRKKLSETRIKNNIIGEKHPRWKGEKVSYRNLHRWVERMIGKPNKCSDCGKIGYGHNMHWANKSHKYKRDIEDWMRLCVSCHKKYDIEYKLIT